MKILIVEDEPSLREIMVRTLTREQYVVEQAADYAAALDKIAAYDYDCILLDIMLPGGSGLRLLEELKRRRSPAAVIIISARDSLDDKIEGLELGADDYLPKPVSPRELLARIRAVLRRSRPVPGAPQAEGGRVAFGPFVLDLGARELRRDGSLLKLTSGEFAVLSVLLRHPRQPLSRDRLMSLAHGREHEAFERSIDVAIARLRKMLEDDPRNPRMIQTVWGTGYVFVPPDATA